MTFQNSNFHIFHTWNLNDFIMDRRCMSKNVWVEIYTIFWVFTRSVRYLPYNKLSPANPIPQIKFF